MSNQWEFFPVSTQGARAICKREGIPFETIHNQRYPELDTSHCLRTGCKLSWHRDYGYIVFGYGDARDTIPYRRYVNKKYTWLDGWFNNVSYKLVPVSQESTPDFADKYKGILEQWTDGEVSFAQPVENLERLLQLCSEWKVKEIKLD